MSDSHFRTLAVVDGGMISGWRRAKPSLAQLHQAVEDLRGAHPGLAVAVVGDPSLKHSLVSAEQVLLEADIASGAIVFAPAGTIGGFTRFMARVVERATDVGFEPVVVTDQSVPGATLGQVRMDGARWVFELGEVQIPPEAVTAAAAAATKAAAALEAARDAQAGARSSRARSGRSSPARSGRGGSTKRSSGRAAVPATHKRLLDAIAVELASVDPDGDAVGRIADPSAVGRAAVRALLRAAG